MRLSSTPVYHVFAPFNPNDHCFHFLHTDMHSPLDSIPHIFGRMHAPVHRRTCFQHICTHTRSHAPSIPQQTFCCFLCLSLLVAISLCFLLYVEMTSSFAAAKKKKKKNSIRKVLDGKVQNFSPTKFFSFTVLPSVLLMIPVWLRHIHLRGKWRPRTPRWYCRANTYKVNGKSEFADFELKW